jgi:hypothetical protein
VSFLDPISGFFSRVSRSVPFSKKKDPRRGGGPKKGGGPFFKTFSFQILIGKIRFVILQDTELSYMSVWRA